MTAPPFDYSNLGGHRRGPVLALLGALVPGVARVQRDVVPFAQAWQHDNTAAIEGDAPLWVALGDSLTQGIGAPAHDRGWVGQLRGRLAAGRADPALAVVNLAVSGATTGDVLERQVPALATLPLDRVSLVTLMIGSNDLMRPAGRGELPGRMAALLDGLAAALGDVTPRRTVVTTLPNPTTVAERTNAAIRAAARRDGLVVADLRDPRTTSWRGKLAADHFHPNEAGYAALADVLADTVEPLLPAR